MREHGLGRPRARGGAGKPLQQPPGWNIKRWQAAPTRHPGASALARASATEVVAVIELEWLRGGTGLRLQPLSHPRGPQVYNIWFPQLERLVLLPAQGA